MAFSDFAALREDLHALRACGSYDRAGAWSLGQICDHLTTFMRGSLEGFGFRLPWYMRLAGPLILRSTLQSRRIPAGIKTPPPLMPAVESNLQDAAAIDALLAMLDRYEQHTGPMQPSALFGRLSREQWDQIHLIHAAHHLSFITPRRPQT